MTHALCCSLCAGLCGSLVYVGCLLKSWPGYVHDVMMSFVVDSRIYCISTGKTRLAGSYSAVFLSPFEGI